MSGGLTGDACPDEASTAPSARLAATVIEVGRLKVTDVLPPEL
jgi:hypothetical protein